MTTISAVPLPIESLLARYAGDIHYTDCFSCALTGQHTQAEFVYAFYTTRLFKLERLLLSWFARKPSCDDDALALARGDTSTFAAWHVEDRNDHQLLLCDFMRRTRSWLMTTRNHDGPVATTQLYFGSAVVAQMDKLTGQARMTSGFRVLLGFHKLYSRLLLAAAVRKLQYHQKHRIQ